MVEHILILMNLPGGPVIGGVPPWEDLPTIGERAETQQAVSQGSLVVWGTDVDVSLSKEKFKNFMFFYVNDDAENEEIHIMEEPYLAIDCRHLRLHDEALYYDLIRYPREVIPAFDMAVNEVFFDNYPDTNLPHQIQRPYNADKTNDMRLLNHEERWNKGLWLLKPNCQSNPQKVLQLALYKAGTKKDEEKETIEMRF
ncbi:hypothetical protein QYM36_018007 [Artemia franciscana]|uniref:MCM N-terminal domain-containing protein n=1 Tax=Artemia franciscana TaxID=6661 RepID=A0AA88KUD3_ARTSF|nr:hypothetical protein QYM36_018007 [Artemia franciscana]